MSGVRQLFLGFFMALVSSTIVLGSLSLSLLEGGYVLAQAPAPGNEMVFSSEPILKLAGSAVAEENVPAAPAEEVTLLTPTSSGCPHPADWVAIVVGPEDTLRTLAHRYDTSVHLLMTNNCLAIESLMANSILYVPNVPPRPIATRPRPTYPSWTYPTPYPTFPSWPTATPWFPTSTPVIQPTLPPTWPPTLPPTMPPPTDSSTATQPPPATVTPQPPPTEPPPTQPPPTEPPPPTQPPPPPPTEPPPPPPPTPTVEMYPFP